MTQIALGRISRPSSLLAEIRDRHELLANYGLALLALGVVAMAMQGLDGRTLAGGVNVWVKPAKFLVSIGVFALTAAWFFGYVRPERRNAPSMRRLAGVLIAAGTFELAYICWQAMHGAESHFNVATTFHALMYALMGLGAVLLVGTTLPLAWEIARRPRAGLQRSFVAAVVIGLVVTFVLGGGLGGYMSAQAGHAVGMEGGSVPLFGWNRLGGDLRVAHFLGIHAGQAMPLLAAMTAGAGPGTRWLVLAAGTAGYVAFTLGVFIQAVHGMPFLPG